MYKSTTERQRMKHAKNWSLAVICYESVRAWLQKMLDPRVCWVPIALGATR